ncbi:MAG TPA: carbohydrate ABC transporter permease [Clostridia bacterium]|nr:carbohydrate ABC transporter permease [Clostridia bacterium]
MSTKSIRKKSRLNQTSFKANAIINGFFILYSAACILPLLLVIAVSFTSEKALAISGYSFIPKEFTFDSYKFVFNLGDAIVRAYGITILVTVVGTIISTMVISMYAYPISRKDFRYKGFFSFIVFFTMIYNSGLVPWYVVYANILHLKDNILVYIIPMVVNTWYVLIMRTFYKLTIPDAIIESSKIDGAGEFRTFVQIVLPLSLPGIATISLFQCLNYWNDWFIALMFIENNKLFNLQYLLYQILNTIQFLASVSGRGGKIDLSKIPNESARMAMAVVVMGPIIFIYPFFQKYFIKGLTVGAVKG